MKWTVLFFAVALALPIAAAWGQTPPASPTPSATQTSVPGHPLQVLYGPHPASATSMAAPDVTGLAHLEGIAAVSREFGNRAPTRLAGYSVTKANADGNSTRFVAEIWFASDDGGRTLRTSAWTKVGDFVTTVPANSPVTEVRQTEIAGLAALTLLPTPAVAGGVGARTIYLTDGSTIWSLELEGFTENSEALALAAVFAANVRTPNPPAVGDSRVSQDGDGLPIALLGAALAAGGVMLFGFDQFRRR